MSKRIQVLISDEAIKKLESVYNKATKDFKSGVIKIGDVVTEMILQSDIDIKELRIKHTDTKRTLIELAETPELDIDLAIKTLQELKNKGVKKSQKQTPKSKEVINEL